MKKIKLSKEPDLLARYEAFPYQKEAFEAVKDLEYAAIFHEQGLGKTKIAIDLLLYWLRNTSIDTVMIVTKKQLIANWVREFQIHTAIKPAILNSNSNDNFRVFCGPYRTVLTNFETIVSEKDQCKLYLNARNVAIIVDESAKLKNPSAKLTKAFFELAPYFKKRVIMTGTPVANRPYDIWAQIYFLDQGGSLGNNFNEFKKETDLSNKLAENDECKQQFEKKVSQIFEKISSFSVRETKDSGIIELPDKIYIQEAVDFEPEQKAMYDQICKDLRIEVVKNEKLILDDSSAIVKRLLRLVQVASNPRLIDEAYSGGSAKEIKLDRLITKIIQQGEKAIIWSNFIENVNYFSKKYSSLGSIKIHGKMSMEERNRSVKLFYLDDYKLLFATPASAKEGLTLTMANHVVFYDRGFSLDDYLQAQDRIHRISQTKTCFVHNIIMNGSIDEWIDALLQAKQNAASLAQGDFTKEQYVKVANYSFGDLIKEVLMLNDTDE